MLQRTQAQDALKLKTRFSRQEPSLQANKHLWPLATPTRNSPDQPQSLTLHKGGAGVLTLLEPGGMWCFTATFSWKVLATAEQVEWA